MVESVEVDRRRQAGWWARSELKKGRRRKGLSDKFELP